MLSTKQPVCMFILNVKTTKLTDNEKEHRHQSCEELERADKNQDSFLQLELNRP